MIPSYDEGIQVKKFNGKCYVFLVSAGDDIGTASQLIKVDFGSSFSNNNPLATSLGNIGGLNFPHDLFITQDGDNFYGFTVNINDNSITRFDFGTDLSAQPTGINLGNIGNLNYPCGFSFINSNGSWHAFITNRNSNTISRLDFGNSLINFPSGSDIGNPGNFLNKPRDISIFQSCSETVGLVVNEEDEQTGSIIKLNFNSDFSSNLSALSLGNIGDLKFPHSISKLFLNGNDIYSFITNVSNNTITKLRYIGCTNSSIASSTLKTPPAVSYTKPGIYSINLLVDIGLPTETSFCKQIVVKNCNVCDSLKVNAGKDTSICSGASVQLKATGATKYNWNTSSFLSDTAIANPIAKPTSTTQFIVTGYDSSGICSAKDTVKISILSLPVFAVNNDTSVCIGSTVHLNATANANYSYHWSPANYLSNASIANPVSTPADSIKYFINATDSNNCRSTDSVQINVVPVPVISTINDTSICAGNTVLLKTNASNASEFVWSPSSGLNTSTIQSPQAVPTSTTTYIITADNGVCSEKDSVKISVYALPLVNASNDTIVCGSGSVQLSASGAQNYKWYPASGLSGTAINNPTAQPSATTTYYVTGTDMNGCTNKDSVIIAVQPKPVFDINPKTISICVGDSIQLSASGGDIYKWSPAQSVSNATSSTATVFPISNTTYQVIISNSICKQSDSLTAVVDIKSTPQTSVSKSNDVDCNTPQAQLTAAGGINYKWSPSTYINNIRISNPVVDPIEDTWYKVSIVGNNGCLITDSILIKSSIANANGNFYVPNAFSPNGDGKNDCFGVKYWGPANFFTMSIYNRWGQLVFHSQNINNCWDGTINGIPQPAGTYVYEIGVSSACSKGIIYRKGTVVLIR